VIVHPGYARPSKHHDLALLLFDDQEFKISSTVRPICLWNEDYDIDAIANTTGMVISP